MVHKVSKLHVVESVYWVDFVLGVSILFTGKLRGIVKEINKVCVIG